MSAFTENSEYIDLPDNRFILSRPLKWEVGREGSGLWITVPTGFKFDISVPRWLWLIVSPMDKRFVLAACLHDWLLQDGWAHNRAAIEFYHGLKAQGCGRVMRVIATIAVMVYTTI